MTGRVKNAGGFCFEVLSRQSFPVVLLAQPDQRLPERGVLGSCADRGQPEPGQAHLALALLAHDGSLSSTGLFSYLWGRPAPSVLSAYATPSALGPSGGTVTVTAG